MTIPQLSYSERLTFAVIYAAPDCTLSELAALTSLSSKSVARAVVKLERRGLVVTGVRHVPARPGRPPHTRRHVRPAAWTVGA